MQRNKPYAFFIDIFVKSKLQTAKYLIGKKKIDGFQNILQIKTQKLWHAFVCTPIYIDSPKENLGIIIALGRFLIRIKTPTSKMSQEYVV